LAAELGVGPHLRKKSSSERGVDAFEELRKTSQMG
jgi:hypothetical protein